MDGAQAAETSLADACALQIGPLDAPRVADDDGLDVALAVDERADLSACLVGEFRELARELGRNDLLRRDAPRVEFFDAPELVRFQPLRVSLYVTNCSSSDGIRSRKNRNAPLRTSRRCVRFDLKLEG
jgi:hypothetical protein